MLLTFPHQGVKIAGIGHYLPERIVSNQELVAAGGLPIDDAWIRRRVGVEQRHVAAPEESTSDLGLAAARDAMAAASTSPDELDLIICSTISPDHPNPATACAIQAGLGAGLCPAYDLTAACSGFLYALDAGARQILTGARKVLIVSAEIRSRFVNPKDPATAPIFGDAAAAVVLEPAPVGTGIMGLQLMADGQGYFSVHIPAGGARLPASHETVDQGQHFIRMENGEKIFFEVVEGMTVHTQAFLTALGSSLDEVDFVIPHQANLMILKEVARRLALPPEKMLINVQQVGNTSSASIPLALSWFRDRIPAGSRVLMVAVGAGHTMGLGLLRT
ncbi:MAG: 3-oxoacyl-ACP synthase III family protein [Candidatus Sericytochromatia bacterium]